MYSDPFFQVKRKPISIPYLEDIHRTYGPPLPKRNSDTFERALKYRQKERERVDALVEENTELRKELDAMTSINKRAFLALQSHKERYAKNSKGKENEPPSNGNSGGTSPDDVPSIQTSNCNPGGGHEKVRELRGDMGGQGAKHSDEGRQERNEGEPERSVEGSGSENGESVPGGGDIGARGANDDE